MNDEAMSGKGKKAKDRLEAIRAQTDGIVPRLELARTALDDIIAEKEGTEWKTKRHNAVSKKRSAVERAPGRIEFMEYGLHFYIDFTFAASESEGLVNVEGCIVYGVSRPLCFAKCIFPEDGRKGETCERISRCDQLEDKPLVKFTVNRDGIIRSSGDLDDQWRIQDPTNGCGAHEEEKERQVQEEKEKRVQKENEKQVRDLHYRALDDIWGDALNWTNENILP